jgi:hypothetical protein
MRPYCVLETQADIYGKQESVRQLLRMKMEALAFRRRAWCRSGLERFKKTLMKPRQVNTTTAFAIAYACFLLYR